MNNSEDKRFDAML